MTNHDSAGAPTVTPDHLIIALRAIATFEPDLAGIDPDVQLAKFARRTARAAVERWDATEPCDQCGERLDPAQLAPWRIRGVVHPKLCRGCAEAML
jgi:hypothetical protein